MQLKSLIVSVCIFGRQLTTNKTFDRGFKKSK